MSAAGFVPPDRSLRVLREAVQGCRGCPLYRPATQAVFGAGTSRARIMLVGEQPGDKEDLAGKPFVGPAGRLLDRALTEAGIDRKDAYVTNAVKHFKYTPRGERRIHVKPGTAEVLPVGPGCSPSWRRSVPRWSSRWARRPPDRWSVGR